MSFLAMLDPTPPGSPGGRLCRHCQYRAAKLGKRGLCYACYDSLRIRCQYPPESAMGNKALGGELRGSRPLPAKPTEYPPGSPEKVLVMRERARQRVQLFHPQDAVKDPEVDSRGDDADDTPILEPFLNMHAESYQARRALHASRSTGEPKHEWIITTPDGRTLSVRATTKSEARARGKELLNIHRRGRLPEGSTLERVGAKVNKKGA